MFRIQETHEGNGEDLNGETPIRISVNSSGDSVHDDTSTLYHTGTFRNQFNAPLSLPPVQSVFARGRSVNPLGVGRKPKGTCQRDLFDLK